MLVSQYGLKKPARINYGAEDPGPRAIFNTSSEEFLRYPLWILEKPDGTQVSFSWHLLVGVKVLNMSGSG